MSYGPAFCRRRCKTLESHAQSLFCRQRERHCGSESTCDPLNHGLLFRPQTFHQSISLLLRRFCRHQQSCSFPFAGCVVVVVVVVACCRGLCCWCCCFCCFLSASWIVLLMSPWCVLLLLLFVDVAVACFVVVVVCCQLRGPWIGLLSSSSSRFVCCVSSVAVLVLGCWRGRWSGLLRCLIVASCITMCFALSSFPIVE